MYVCKLSTGLLAGIKAGRVHLCRVAGNTVQSHMAGMQWVYLKKSVAPLTF